MILPDTVSDFIAAYFPNITELTAAQILSARDRLETWVRAGFPGEDLRPNSVVGDRVLTPFSHLFAGWEVALQRLCSDLDLENAANSVVYNCAFVNRYLTNFSSYSSTTLKSRGIVRLVFNSNTAVVLDRATLLQLNTRTMALVLPFAGALSVLPAGTVYQEGVNVAILTDMVDGTYAADIAVYGDSGAVVTAGTGATLSVSIATLVSATALYDFDLGSAVSSTVDAAQRARYGMVSATPASREGLKRLVAREFSDMTAVHITIPGDDVNLRSTVSTLGFANPAVDVFVHSSQYGAIQTQRVRLPFVAAQGNASVNKFLGKLSLVGNPIRIRSITSAEKTSLVWIPKTTPGCVIYSRSRAGARAPLLSAAGSRFEELWAAIDMPALPIVGGNALSTSIIDGIPYALFDVTYEYEPITPQVQSVLESDEYRAVGLDVLVRPATAVSIERFHVKYAKPDGVNVNITAARAAIYNSLKKFGGDHAFSQAQIADIMFYHRATDVRNIDVRATANFTAANFVLPNTAAELDVNFASGVSAAVAPPSYQIANPAALAPTTFVDPSLGTGSETFSALCAGSLGFVLDPERITFEAV